MVSLVRDTKKIASYAIRIFVPVIVFMISIVSFGFKAFCSDKNGSNGSLGLVTYSTVEEMRNSDIAVGTLVTTGGFYSINDGGNASYKIEKERTFGAIKLNTGLYANPVFDDGIVNVKAIGAVGDGITDDSAVIDAALNSGYRVVSFPKANYACNSHIVMKTNGVTVIGNKSTLLTNDNFYSDYKEWFFTIRANSISIQDLRFECLETHTHKFKTQMGIMDSNNVKISTCEFYIPHDVIAANPTKKIEYTNLDIYSGCYNITVDNCLIINKADAYAGLCCMIRDLFGKGSSGISFTNNTCYHTGRDEVFAAFSNVTHASQKNSMSDVTIKGNKFYKSEDYYNSNVGITLGFENDGGIDGLIFSDNYASFCADCMFFKLGSSTNVIMSNNTLECKILSGSSRMYMLYAYDGASSIYFYDNDVTVYQNSPVFNFLTNKGKVYIGDNDIRIR